MLVLVLVLAGGIISILLSVSLDLLCAREWAEESTSGSWKWFVCRNISVHVLIPHLFSSHLNSSSSIVSHPTQFTLLTATCMDRTATTAFDSEPSSPIHQRRSRPATHSSKGLMINSHTLLRPLPFQMPIAVVLVLVAPNLQVHRFLRTTWCKTSSFLVNCKALRLYCSELITEVRLCTASKIYDSCVVCCVVLLSFGS